MAEPRDSAPPAKVQKLSTPVLDISVSSEVDNSMIESLAQTALEEIDGCQNEIDSLNEKASEEILQVEMKYNKLRKPHYQKRNELISQIPNFWMTVFFNHPQLSTIISEQEEECLQFLKQVSVEEFEDIKSGYSISFHFSYNPFFSNPVIKKEYHLAAAGGRPGSKCSAINWKPNRDLLRLSAMMSRKRKGPTGNGESFFSWLTSSADPAMDKLADLIKDDIWLNPLQYYLAPDISLDENGVSDDTSSDDDVEDDSVVIVGDDDDDDDDDDVYEVEGDSFDENEDELLEETVDSIEVESDDDDDAIEVLGSDSEPESSGVKEVTRDSADSTCEPGTSAVDTTQDSNTESKSQPESKNTDQQRKADSSIEDGKETTETEDADTSQTVDTGADMSVDESTDKVDTGADNNKVDTGAAEEGGTGDTEKGNG